MSGPSVRLSLALMLGLGAPGAVCARDAGVSDTAIAAAVADPARSATARAFDAGRQPAKVLAFAHIRRGDVVGEWGAGSGYYTTMLSGLVGPKGAVYAIDIAANQDAKEWAPILAHHPNIRTLFVPGEAEMLAPGGFDVIFAHLEYHDLYWSNAKAHYPVRDVPAVLRNWFAALRPGGRVIVIDHVGLPGDPRVNADKYHRIDLARVKADFATVGFVLEESSDVLHREDDPHTIAVFDPSVRGHTDRFVFCFAKPAK